MRFALSVMLAFSVFSDSFGLDPAPLPKHGGCPGGYSQSGIYCNPSSGARFAVSKIGGCPSGYSQSGDCCLSSK